MTPEQAAERLALRELAERYARAVDRRDVAEFLPLFEPDARLRVFDPPDAEKPVTDRQGHEQLAVIPEAIKRYVKTFHLIGNATYEVDGSDATGEVYCTAHHINDEGVDRVMYIRYHDRYRRDDGGTWRIADRQLQVDWVDHQPVRS